MQHVSLLFMAALAPDSISDDSISDDSISGPGRVASGPTTRPALFRIDPPSASISALSLNETRRVLNWLMHKPLTHSFFAKKSASLPDAWRRAASRAVGGVNTSGVNGSTRCVRQLLAGATQTGAVVRGKRTAVR